MRSHGTIKQAIEANVRAAKDKLRTSDVIASGVKSGRVLVVGGVYQLGSGAVTLVE